MDRRIAEYGNKNKQYNIRVTSNLEETEFWTYFAFPYFCSNTCTQQHKYTLQFVPNLCKSIKITSILILPPVVVLIYSRRCGYADPGRASSAYHTYDEIKYYHPTYISPIYVLYCG